MAGSAAHRHGSFGAAVDALVPALRSTLGEDLVAVAVFGSVVRGEARADSDLDVLVVAAAWPRGMTARLERLEAVSNSIESVLRAARPLASLSLIPRTPEEVRRGGPLYFDMTVEGEVDVLFDPSGVLADALRRLRDRLAALGARRATAGGHRYWILKPDHRLGETFTL